MEGLFSGMGSGHGGVGDRNTACPASDEPEPWVDGGPTGALSTVVVDVSNVTWFSVSGVLEFDDCGVRCTLGVGSDFPCADRTGWNPGGGSRGAIPKACGLTVLDW
jgi:hypothetical protein